MATNGSSSTQTISSNPASSPAAPKRRGGRKASASKGSTPAVRKSEAGALETLFKEQPNPFRQPEPPFIWIDYPQQNERLFGPVYNIRLGVGGAEAVEISIDKSAWLPCRSTSGYWWYDWSNIRTGKHTLVARMRLGDGRWFRTPPRTCEFRP